MMNCTILDDYQNVALSLANWTPLEKNICIKSHQQHFKTEKDLIEAIRNDEIVVIMRERTAFTESLFEKLPRLKLLITSGMRNVAIDLDAASKYGIIVSGTKSYSDPPVELTWALIHVLSRHIIIENEAVKTGHWQSTIGIDLKGKQLGILGLGKIGIAVAKIGHAFGMNVVAWSENLTRERAVAEGVQFAQSKNELLEKSDFISIHLVLSDRTHHLIKAEDFQRMKKNACLINTSRASIVDQQAMIDALHNKKIAGAASDVFEIEPLPVNHILRTLPNLIVTPHIGYVTERNYQAYFGETVENIQAYLSGNPIRQLIK